MNKYFLLQVEKVLKFINMFTMDNTTDSAIYTLLSVVNLLKKGVGLQQLFIEKIKQTTSSSTSTKILKKLMRSSEAGFEEPTRNEDMYSNFWYVCDAGRVYGPCRGVRCMIKANKKKNILIYGKLSHKASELLIAS